MQTPPVALKQNTAADDEELAYWTIVEGTCSHDNDDSAVTSSYWVTVEKMMGATAIEENETCDEESNIPIAEKTTIETVIVDDCSKITSQTVAFAPEMKQTTGSSMSSAAD